MAEETKTENNVIYVGKKPIMAYVLAAITQFSDGQNAVHIKARGKAISRAVDVAEMVKNRFVTNALVEKIEIGTEKVKSEEKEVNVSTIDIVLKKE